MKYYEKRKYYWFHKLAQQLIKISFVLVVSFALSQDWYDQVKLICKFHSNDMAKRIMRTKRIRGGV